MNLQFFGLCVWRTYGEDQAKALFFLPPYPDEQGANYYSDQRPLKKRKKKKYWQGFFNVLKILFKF